VGGVALSIDGTASILRGKYTVPTHRRTPAQRQVIRVRFDSRLFVSCATACHLVVGTAAERRASAEAVRRECGCGQLDRMECGGSTEQLLLSNSHISAT
jgi:hypothetical protein